MTEFSRLLRYLKPYRTIFAISVVLMIATGLLEGGTILLLKPIIDTIKGGHSEGGVFAGLPFGQYLPKASDLRAIAVLLVGLTLAKGVAEYFSSYFMSHIGQSVIADIRSSLYDHITRQAAPFFSRHSTNELTAHLMSDAALVERAVSIRCAICCANRSVWSFIWRCSSASTGGWPRRYCCWGRQWLIW
jgi:ABC-type multidrug transport system fused ATPase/permease subunit